MHSVPKTGQWFDSSHVADLINPTNRTPLENIALPVIFRSKSETASNNSQISVYELSEIVNHFCKKKDSTQALISRVKNLEPVRYPGFKNYRQTVKLLQLITENNWKEKTDIDSAPSVEEGEQMDQPSTSVSDRSRFVRFQCQKVCCLKNQHYFSEIYRNSETNLIESFNEWIDDFLSSRSKGAWVLGGGSALFLAGGLAVKALTHASTRK